MLQPLMLVRGAVQALATLQRPRQARFQHLVKSSFLVHRLSEVIIHRVREAKIETVRMRGAEKYR